MTKTVQKIKVEKKQFYTFIQTDKPIYKPGDTVRFRVVVIDRDLRPYHMNRINIYATDSINRVVQIFDDIDDEFLGVIKGNFSLSQNASVGTWKLEVDLQQQYPSFKEFAVRNITPKPLSAYLIIDQQHLLPNSTLNLSFYAKNQADDFVKGNAQLTIKCTSTGQTIISKTFNNVIGIQNIKHKIRNDIKSKLTEKLDYQVTLDFTEPESNTKSYKSLKFTVHHSLKPKIRVNHSEKLMPGLPFNAKVFVYDWKDSLIMNSLEKVKVVYQLSFQNGSHQELAYDTNVKEGADHSLIVPEGIVEMTFKVKYDEVIYEKTIFKGFVAVGVNRIFVDHSPKK